MRASISDGHPSSASSRVALRERSRAPRQPHTAPTASSAPRQGAHGTRGLRWRYLFPLGVALLWLAGMVLPLPNLGAWLAHLRPPAAPIAQTTLRGTALNGVPAPDFQLQDQNGQPVSLARFHGQPVVLTFFDSVCPHAECSLMAQYLEWSAQFLGADTNRVAWVALSVNPWHDTPATARAFLTSHNVTLPIHYVLGSVDQMSALWKAYHMQAILQADGIVIHTTGVYVLDGQGHERIYLDEGFDPHDLSGDLRTLLAQGGASAATSASAPGNDQSGTSQTQTANGDQITLIARPGQFGTYTFSVKLTDSRGEAITGATVSADLTMTDMAMEPEHVTLAPQGTDGTYTVDGVLTMAGHWKATLHIQRPTRPQVLPGLPAVAPAPLTATFSFTARY